MRPKDLYKRNTIVLSDDSVIKTVRMPFAFLSNRCCQHEANALRRLEDLGFAHAPRLLDHRDNVLTMTRVAGSTLGPKQTGNKEVFLSIVACVNKLHSFGFAHGNITRKNILLTDRGEIHLIDFETNCSRSSPFFHIMKAWDCVRLYQLSSRVFRLDSAEVQGAFPQYARTAIRVVRPFYKLERLAKTLKRRMLGTAGSLGLCELVQTLSDIDILALSDTPFG
jgi:serine/threonine-protein kinase RIO1